MGELRTPLIKGMFVNSHIRRLRNEKGAGAVEELSKRYGKPLVFRNLEEVPVREEIAILEHVFDILHEHDGQALDPALRSFEAGRLHLQNFLATSFGLILVAAAPKTPAGFKKLMLSAKYIATHVFKNTNLRAYAPENDPQSLIIVMENNDYPLNHFKGLFFEWMKLWGLTNPRVDATEPEPRLYQYSLHWDI